MTAVKTILLLGRRDDRPDYDTPDSMVASLRDQPNGLNYQAACLEEISIAYDGDRLRLTDERTGTDLKDYAAIFLFGWFKSRRYEEIALAVSLYAKAHGVKTYNSEALYTRSRSKISQYVLSVMNGVSTMPFVTVIDHDLTVALAERLGIQYPMIIKAATGSRGQHNYLVHNRQELAAAVGSGPTKVFVVQPFIPNDGDYRLIVADGDVKLAIHRRASKGKHVNNTSQGAQASLTALADLPAAMLRDAVSVAHCLRREVTGVDMITDKQTGAHYFLEANNMPQLSTGSFVPQKAAVLNAVFEATVGETAKP